MRVLFVEPFGQHDGHPSVDSKRVTGALAEAEVNVTLVTFDGVRGDWVETHKLERHLSVISQSGFFSWLPRLVLMMRKLLVTRLAAYFLESLLTLFLAARECRKQDYDAVHVLDGVPVFTFLFPGALFTKNQNYVVNIHNPRGFWKLEGGFQKLKKSLRQRDYQDCLHLMLFRVMQAKPMALLDRFIYHRGVRGNSFHFICHTKEIKESHKEYLDGVFYDKINVIPLGRKKLEQKAVSTRQAREYLQLPQEAKIFLSFGTNHPGKNLEVIFQAAQDMPKNMYFIFVGKLVESGKARDPVTLAQEYGWAENTVVVNQFISDEEKPYYFYASDAIFLSYIRSATAYASVLNDACQFQLPVIASDVGQLGEDVTTYNLGITFIPEDPDSLRQATVSFLSLTEAEILALKANCRKFVSSFSTEDEANRYMALYSERA